MTIPTRDDALKALDAALWAASAFERTDDIPAADVVRSYIESHMGEPVAWKYRQIGMSTWNYIEERLGGDYDKFYEYEPLYASPVQPALEWGNDTFLRLNGRAIGHLSRAFGGTHAVPNLLGETLARAVPIDEAKCILMSAARQWLSIGDK